MKYLDVHFVNNRKYECFNKKTHKDSVNPRSTEERMKETKKERKVDIVLRVKKNKRQLNIDRI